MSRDDIDPSPSPGPLDRALRKTAKLVFPSVLALVLIDQRHFLLGTLSRGQVFGRDAYNFWLAGRMAIDGRALAVYDHAAFAQAAEQAVGAGAGLHVFAYPPPALLGMAPFGTMSYGLALALMSALGLAGYLLATCHRCWDRSTLALALMAPPTLLNLALGQNGLLSAALFVGGLQLVHRRPVLAGALIGLLVYKPLLAVLIPIPLLLQRRWTTIATAALTVGLLCALPTLIWGPEIWVRYVLDAVPWQRDLLEHGVGSMQAMKPSAFIGARMLGASVVMAYWAQAVVSACTLLVVVRHFWRARNTGRIDGKDLAILALSTMLITPYVHVYDLAVVAAALIVMARADTQARVSAAELAMLILLWAAPLLAILANLGRVPLYPVLMLAILVAWTRASGPASASN